MAYLIVEKAATGDIGKKFSLDEKAVLIGRGTADHTPDVNLQDKFVSRRHAEISFANNCFLLRDLNSTNGTALDGRRIEPQTPYRLQDEATIGLGVGLGGDAGVLLRFKESPTTATASLTANGVIAPLGWLKIDLQRGEIWVDGKRVVVSRKEYDLILCLQRKAGKVCSKDELVANVWPEAIDAAGVSDAAIDQLLHRLRLKIEPDSSNPQRLISRRGFGYILA